MQRFLNNWSVLCTATEAHFGKGTKGDTALPTLPNPHYPSKIANTLALLCTITLASLVKGRWIDGKAQTVALLRLNCDTPALFITKPFCRQDGGIASPPSLRTTFLPPLVKGEVMSPEKIRATTGGIAFRCTEYCHSHNHCKKTIIPRKPPTPLPPLEKV